MNGNTQFKDDAFWEQKDAKRRDEINWAQSFNLAVALIAPNVLDKSQASVDDTKKTIRYWQEWFYSELKKRPALKEADAKSTKKKIKDVGRETAETDIDHSENDD